MAVKIVSHANLGFRSSNPGPGTVLLHLYAGALARRLSPSETVKPIPAVYIAVPSPFPTLETFIDESAKRYNLDLFHCRPASEPVESVATPAPTIGTDYMEPAPKAVGKAKGAEGMKQALEIYKNKFPNIDAILIGTRRTDPHGGALETIHSFAVLITSC
jgi:FAD synthetase